MARSASAAALSDAEFPETYSPTKPETIFLDRVYVHVGHEYIWFGKGGDIKRGGLIRTRAETFGPQRDPLERLAWAQDKVANFKQYLFNEVSHVALDANGNYNDIDGGGRALIAHILGHPTIEAFVEKNLAPKEVARRFREHAHSKVALGAVQDFLTFVAEGSPMHVRIRNAIAPNYSVKKSGVDAINSVKALYDIYNSGGETETERLELLRLTSRYCATAWKPKFETIKGGKKKRTKPGFHVPGIAFVAVALVLQALPAKFDEAKLRKVLASHSPKEINDVANDELTELAQAVAKKAPKSAFKLLSQHLATPMANVIARAYNNRLDADYDKIDISAIKNSLLAQQFSKLR